MQRADASFLSQSFLSLVLLSPSMFHFPPQRPSYGFASVTTAASVYLGGILKNVSGCLFVCVCTRWRRIKMYVYIQYVKCDVLNSQDFKCPFVRVYVHILLFSQCFSVKKIFLYPLFSIPLHLLFSRHRPLGCRSR